MSGKSTNPKRIEMKDLVRDDYKSPPINKKNVYMGDTAVKSASGLILPHKDKAASKIMDKDGNVVTSSKSGRGKEFAKRQAEFLKDQERKAIYHDEEQKKIEEYNKQVEIIDPLYSEDLEFVNNRVLIRLYKLDHIKDGLIRRHQIERPSKSGYGDGTMVDDPYPFDMHGIVINPGTYTTMFATGDKIVVMPRVVQTEFMQHVQDFVINNSFVRPDQVDETKSHPGYFLVPAHDIICKIKNVKTNESKESAKKTTSKKSTSKKSND